MIGVIYCWDDLGGKEELEAGIVKDDGGSRIWFRRKSNDGGG